MPCADLRYCPNAPHDQGQAPRRQAMTDDEEIVLSDGFPGGFPSDYLVEMYYRRAREDELERERKEIPERYDGRALCFACGKQVRDHPLDPTFPDYNGEPFVHLLCDGQRAKT